MNGSSGKKNVVVILNGISLHKKIFYHDFLPVLSKICEVEVFETLSKNDAIRLASKAADQYVDLILAAGGDGTLNQVLNGVITGRETGTKLPVIGLIPIGSGNDFARTAGIKDDPAQLKKLIHEFKPKKIDIGKIVFKNFPEGPYAESAGQRYFVNVADMGMGPMVVDKVLKSGRAFGHGIAYYKSILSTFLSYKPMVVKVSTKSWNWEGKLRTLAIANGKCYGHGLCIAPDAILDDRKLNVFICGDVSVFDFIRYTGKLKKGKHVSHSKVFYKETTSIKLNSEKECMIEGDGEILGLLPAEVILFERQFSFLI